MMTFEYLKTIIAAEDEARESRLLASQTARERVEETQRAGKESVDSTLARAESEIAHLTRALDHKATSEAMELASSTANRQATLRARAERRLDEAVTLIVERIVSV